MSARRIAVGLVLLCSLGLAASCRFDPDLSRFAECAEDGTCPTGHTCLAEEGRCLPDCGAQGPCPPEPPPDAATDAGADGGTDGGADAGEPLALVTDALPAGIETIPYAQELRAHGGVPPYTFRATDALPEWLALDGGTLLGTPPMQGTFRVAVEILDQAAPPARASTAYDLRVRPLLRVAGPGLLVDGHLDTSYTEQLSATGGTPPYLFTLEAGSQLPEGLTLQADGGVRGTPVDSGTYSFQVRVTDADSRPQEAIRSLTVSVSALPLVLTLATQSVPDGRVGTAYQYSLKAVGNTGAVTWTLKAGDLPQGIGFDARTATLQGTPTVAGPKSFTLRVEDSLSYEERTFTLTVY